MTSIRNRLTRWLAVSITLLTFTTCVLLYVYVRRQLVRQFDSDLHARAHSLASLLRIKRDNSIAMDYSDKSMPEYLPGPRAEYFEAVFPDGVVLERSLSLKGKDLVDLHALGAQQGRWDIKLPDGRAGRAIQLVAIPFLDSEDRDEKGNLSQPGQSVTLEKLPRVMFIAARSREDIDHISSVLLWALSIVTASLAGACVLAVRVAVSQGLKPVDLVASQAALIGPQTLDFRFDVNAFPTELRPICLRLNDLLARLHDAFQRERRITADISHELRTPITELRALTEVARLWPDDPARTSAYLCDAHDIAVRMESLVETLLALARSQSRRAEVATTAVGLAALIENRLAQSRAEIARRNLTVSMNIPDTQLIRTDRAIFARIVDNLISNAVHYTPPGGSVELSSQPEGDLLCILRISNDSASLAAGDLAKLFEPFWRKDLARSGGTRLGLGLTLVKEYAEQLNIEVSVSLPSTDRFEISLAIPAEAGAGLRDTALIAASA